ncbi:MAG: glycoside hydrolase family 88 protein [Acholeplasmatales bacterium]|nr:glycoside hydrolase family 88 protein [Acholeplasmatales bacterium]
MYEIINKYIDKLMTSKPNQPLWNIEVIRSGKESVWNYIDGCMMTSLMEMYKTTKDEKYIDFVKKFVDYYVFEDGSIRGYEVEKYSTDDVCESRILFDLYDLTKDEKYNKAIELSYSQVKTHPRTKEGNFWHKLIYPNQIWLDGLYMMQPFYTRYQTLRNGKDYSDIVKQFQNVRNIMFDENAKLYYHGYDSSKSMFWADKNTGLSKNFWLRSIGWFTVGLVDVLDFMDEQMYDEFNTIKTLLKETIDGILQYQDKDSKMFWQVPNFPGREGNYLETSGSSMVAYAVLKGVRLGVLPERYQQIGLDIFNGICNKYLSVKEDGDLNLGGICLVAGLGPEHNLRRDGTYEYYISEPVVENDAKGVGPLIMAYTEVIKINQ